MGFNFGDLFSLVVKFTSIRFLLSLATIFDLEVEKMDLKKMFLHGDLKKKSKSNNLKGL